MSRRGVEAGRHLHALVLELAADLPVEAWTAPSGCPGWQVGDVVAHLASRFRQVVDPGSLPQVAGGTEAENEAWVDERRSLSLEAVVDEFRDCGERAFATLATFQEPQVAETPVDLGDLGTHALAPVADAFAFDLFVHLRADIREPRGPVRRVLPQPDAALLGPVVDWMLAVLPQLAAAILAAGGVELVLEGPAARRQRLGSGTLPARITSSTSDFVLWGTGRADWRRLPVDVEGDGALARRLLDRVHVS